MCEDWGQRFKDTVWKHKEKNNIGYVRRKECRYVPIRN